MKRHSFLKIAPVFGLGLALSLTLPVVAQQSENMPGYPTANAPQSNTPPGNNSAPNPGNPANNPDTAPPPSRPSGPMSAPQGALPQNSMSSPQQVPPTLVLPAGTVIQVRTNQWLSTDRNIVGDGFYATLAQPIVVDGWVVALRGQSILGRVSLSQKANGSNHNTSQLGLQLSELTFADGQLLPIQTQLSQSATGPNRGQQVGTVVTTTGARRDHRRHRWTRPWRRHRRGHRGYRRPWNHQQYGTPHGYSSRNPADFPPQRTRDHLHREERIRFSPGRLS